MALPFAVNMKNLHFCPVIDCMIAGSHVFYFFVVFVCFFVKRLMVACLLNIHYSLCLENLDLFVGDSESSPNSYFSAYLVDKYGYVTQFWLTPYKKFWGRFPEKALKKVRVQAVSGGMYMVYPFPFPSFLHRMKM